MKLKFRRLASVCLTGIMTVSLVASGLLALGKDTDGLQDGVLDTVNFENVTGKVDLTSIALNNLSASVLQNAGYSVKNEKRTVIVTLDDDCLLDSLPDGQTVAEYLNTYSGDKALKNVTTSQQNFLTSLSSLGVDYSVVYQYSTVTNAVAIEVNTQYLSKIKGVANVKSVVVSETYAAPKDVEVTEATGTENYSNIQPTGIYESKDYVSKGIDGRGMTVAILDTGIDYTHKAFQHMPPEVAIEKSDVSRVVDTLNAVSLSAARGNEITADDLYINAKIPFAYDYADKDTDVYPAYSQHGVHVAGIVAGEADEWTDKDGNVQQDFRGVAPNAQLVICKVFTDDFTSRDLGGATSEDIIAALDDCVKLGVDIINMSLGTTAGFSTLYIDGDDEGLALANVYDKIKEAGISLICAASNDFSAGFGSAYGTNLATNPDSGTVGSPSTFYGALSVASVNGQLAPFIVANEKSVIYYTDASDGNGERFNFVKDMLGNSTSNKFKYVVIGNYGEGGDYNNATVRTEVQNKQPNEKLIAVVRRGRTTFQEKVEIAQEMGFDAIIVYNNVAGTIGMSLGDIDDPIPAISVSRDAGELLTYENGRRITTGYIEMSTSYQAGPFMNDYSSWGTSPDLQIKPEITSHGGEITSAVSGGYTEMSGTSMATPNLAGFVALLRGQLKKDNPNLTNAELNRLVNQLIMSTAITVLDQDGDPYSPRKQGAGLATLDNVFNTQAYLYTEDDDNKRVSEDNRPKIELGDFAFESSEVLTFHVKNFGSSQLQFKTQSIVMTETLSSDGIAVAEKGHFFDDCDTVWTVNGQTAGDIITVEPGAEATISATITLSAADKKYIEDRFKNGMFVEGFLKLLSETEGQCDLTLPFMGFYGDWTKAPMLDYDCFRIAQDQKDASILDEDKLQPQVWATQAYAQYYDSKYTVPLGSFMYLQDEYAQQIYTEEEHIALSCFNEYYGDSDPNNYLTLYGFRALYAGLLRNAEIVTYDLYDDVTGEIIKEGCVYRVSKAYANGNSAVPANVKLEELLPSELGLVNNGKYRLDFHFYFKAEDMENEEKVNDPNNQFSMSFYIDYEAPVLMDARIRYYDYKENNRDKQRVYLDLDIYDNHYAQAVILCYSATENDTTELYLATEYVTPVYNAKKNGITTVSIEITDFYEKYSNRLYVQIDDYALNHSVWSLDITSSSQKVASGAFDVVCDNTVKPYSGNGNAYDYEMTLGVNEAYKVSLDIEGTANASNFVWTSARQSIVQVKNGEIFGASAGETTVTVTSASGANKKIRVTVVDRGTSLPWPPTLSFGTIENYERNLVKASGTVRVNAGQRFQLEILADPWYFPIANYEFEWTVIGDDVVEVDENGWVHTANRKGTASITAAILRDGVPTQYVASVTLRVEDPFTITGGVLTAYHGDAKEVILPSDKNITVIDEDAFKDNNYIETVIIPKTVTQINSLAFENCTNLKEVYFISKEESPVVKADLSLILSYAFMGCTSLRKVDLTNTKTITVDAYVFAGCYALDEVVAMKNIGTMGNYAFAYCTSLKEADITGLHNTGNSVFEGCTSLRTVQTDFYSSIGYRIFAGCTALTQITIKAPVVMDYAFRGCTNLTTVTFDGVSTNYDLVANEFTVGNYAFYNCTNLATVNGSDKIVSLGNSAFSGCTALSSINLDGLVSHGINVFDGTGVDSLDDVDNGAIYEGTKLVLAPRNVPAGFQIKAGTTEIAASAFANSRFATPSLVIPDTVKIIGNSAFSGSNLNNITLPDGLEYIGSNAFSSVPLSAITIPASVIEIGASAFRSSSLSQVTFANSSSRQTALTLGREAFFGCRNLTSISLPNLVADRESGMVILNSMMFSGCTSLSSVNLANVNEIGFAAFGGVVYYGVTYQACTSLSSIDLSNVLVVGEGAFAGCTGLTTIEGLDHVEEIGAQAFYYTALTTIDISGAKVVGALAFYGNKETTVNIPAGLIGKTTQESADGTAVAGIGMGAFAGSANLTSFTVDNGNPIYKVFDGVLYREIREGVYEICTYPAGKQAASVNGVRTYEIKEGTIAVQAYAFRGLSSGVIGEVKLPYSVKTIGDGAFYASGISSYVFESITAPVLETSVYDVTEYTGSYYFLYYTNFEDEIINHAIVAGNLEIVAGRTDSNLTISYPTNGTGYDSYAYTYSFGIVKLLGELMDDNTRAAKTAIEGFASADEVSSWNTSNKSKDDVYAFSEAVKAAHALLNNIRSERQLEYLNEGNDNVAKLYAIEAALKPVKDIFNIPYLVSSLQIKAGTSYKTDYVAGEKFDLGSLQLTVTYDDYSTADADMSRVRLSSGYDGELTVFNRYVIVTYEGAQVMVAITVTDGSNNNTQPEEQKKKGCKSVIGAEYGLIALAIIAVGAVLIIKSCKGKNSESSNSDC